MIKPSSQTAPLLIRPFALLSDVVALAGGVVLIWLHRDAVGLQVSLVSARALVLMALGIGLAGVLGGGVIAREPIQVEVH